MPVVLPRSLLPVRSGLRVAVNRDGAGDARQIGSWPDSVRAGARNIEDNSVSARVRIGRDDRLAQSALSVITKACAGISRRIDDEGRACLRRYRQRLGPDWFGQGR